MNRYLAAVVMLAGLLAACGAQPPLKRAAGGSSPAGRPSTSAAASVTVSPSAAVTPSPSPATAPPVASALSSPPAGPSEPSAMTGQLAYVHAGDIWLHDLATATATQLTSDGLSREPTWSPDGETLAFTRLAAPDSAQDTTIWTMRADGSEPQQLTGRGLNTFLPRYAPDGELYYIEHTPGGADTTFKLTRHAAFEPSAVYTLQSGLCGVSGFDIGPDTQWTLALSCGRGKNVLLGKLDSSAAVDLTEIHGITDSCYAGAAWSHGEQPALAVANFYDCLPDQVNVWLWNSTQRSAQTAWLFNGSMIGGLAWSPDDSVLVYSIVRPSSESSVWVVPVDGSGPPTQIVADGSQPAWRPGLNDE